MSHQYIGDLSAGCTAPASDGEGRLVASAPKIRRWLGKGAAALLLSTSASIAVTQTTFAPGELMIVGINANNNACGGSAGEDWISFFCAKPITQNTQLFLTDNGYERSSSQPDGRWGNTEGVLRITRSGAAAIPVGQVVTLKINGSTVTATPTGGWTFAWIAGTGGQLNMNDGGDQLFFLQGGTWNNGTAGNHNATYTGTVIHAFSTNGQWLKHGNSVQESGLPASTACFFIAPTARTDFNKYIGTQTLASWREWIVRIGTSSNWSTTATINNCSTYNSVAPNWNTAPTLPINLTPVVAGRWLGFVDTDWFNCKNWDNTIVPDLSTAVEINSAYADRDCVVGITANGAAQCASLLQTASSGTIRQLTVQSNSTLTVNGPLHINRTATGGSLTTTVTGTSSLNCSTLTISGVTAGATDEAILQCESSTATVQVESHLTINNGGLLDLEGAPSTGGRLLLGGDWTNNESEANFHDQYSTVILNGGGSQTLTTATGPEVFGTLSLEKSTGTNLVMTSPLEVRSNLNLTTGRIITGTHTVTMRAGSVTTGASNNSFVSGPMVKIGNTAFTFPIGKAAGRHGAAWRPAGITPVSGNTTDAFRAEYFPDSGWDWGTAREATIHHVSDCEHWLIDRAAGSTNAQITLTWRAPYSCGVNNMPQLLVARWDAAASIWRDHGGTITGMSTNTDGSITTPSQSLFNTSGGTPWTLGSPTESNPLPITLLEFKARPEGAQVRLDWSTASELDNAYFTVERSRHGTDFERVLDVPGAMNSARVLHYTEMDRSPYQGLSYYRLRQTDVGGQYTHSATVPVMFSGPADRSLVMFNNGSTITAIHTFPAGSRYEIMDMTGRIILEGTTDTDGHAAVDGSRLSTSSYLFRLSDGIRTESQRFVY